MRTSVTNVAILGASLIGGVATARLLGPDQRGEYALVLLWLNLFSAFGSLSLADGVAYFASRDRSLLPSLVSFNLLSSTAAAAVLVPIGFWLLPALLSSGSVELHTLARASLVFVPVNVLTLNTYALLQGSGSFGRYNVCRLVFSGFYVPGLLLVFFVDANKLGLVLGIFVASAFLGMIIGLILLLGVSGGLAPIPPGLAISIGRYGMLAHFGTVMRTLSTRIDQLLVGFLLSPSEVGQYVVALTAVGVLSPLTSAVGTTIFPRVGMARDAAEVRSIVRTGLTWTAGVAFPGVLALMVAMPAALPWVYGDVFSGAIPAAQILLLGALPVGLGQVLVSSLKALDRPGSATRSEFVAVCASACGLTLLVPRFGLVGAAWASVFASVVQLWVSYRSVVRGEAGPKRSPLFLDERSLRVP